MDEEEYSLLKSKLENGARPTELPPELRRFYKPGRNGKWRPGPYFNYTVGKIFRCGVIYTWR
jgi:hypothetical protein